MTIGIYALYWEEQDLIYVGQSVNIEKRHKEHLNLLLKNRHSNRLVQGAYNAYGNPEHIILEILKTSNKNTLNLLEIQWTVEFDSLNTGLNIVYPGAGIGSGTQAGYSKYSVRTVLKAFSLLYRTSLPYAHIADLLDMTKRSVDNISREECHIWLKDKYPEKYDIMIHMRSIRKTTNIRSSEKQGKKNASIVSPEGIIYNNILNIKEFCRGVPEFSDNPISAASGIGAVLRGTLKSYKKWRRKEKVELMRA